VSIFKNKHVRIAIVLAPVLGVVSYYVTRDLGSEAPHAAEEGQSYQLAEKPNCRRDSGICGLKNGDFELNLSTEWLDADRERLMLHSVFPLDGVMVSLVESEAGENQPREMSPLGDDGLMWSLEIPHPDPESDRLHLVASANRTLYYGDASTKFTHREGVQQQD
jgi:hypothetical protein